MHFSTILAPTATLLALAAALPQPAADAAPNARVVGQTPAHSTVEMHNFAGAQDCTGGEDAGTYESGKCVDLPGDGVKSWFCYGDPNSQTSKMSVYAGAGCTGAVGTEQLNGDGNCYAASAIIVSSDTARSICINC